MKKLLLVLLIIASSGALALAQATFLAGEVTDTGGIDDRSFNASAWKGLQDAKAAAGVQIQYLQSTNQSDYVPNIQQFVQKKAGIIVTVGFLMGDDTATAAKANPDQKFAIVDYSYDPAIPNVLALTYQTDQAAFLGGYLAAAMSKTGKVGTFGGMNIPTVTIFMNGFVAGVRYYNKQNKANVQVLGWDPEGNSGTFTNDFTNQAKGKTVTETLMNQGADIVLQLAGNSGLGVIEAVREADQRVWAIGADIDQEDMAPGRVLVSVLKRIDVAVFDAIREARAGQLQAGHRWIGIAEGATGLTDMRHTRRDVPDRAIEMVKRAEALIKEAKLAVPWRIEDLETFQIPQI